MKRKIMGILAFAFAATMAINLTAFAGTWRVDGGKWWYDNGNGTYLANGWHWLDGNGDAIAECYYFDEAGWLLTQTITPDGYQVNENGAWTINGAIQTRSVNGSGSDKKIPNGAITYNGHHYYFYSDVCDTWEEAEAYCASMGGYLAIINDEEENIALYDAMKEAGYQSAYFGLSDAEKEGDWKWVDGTAPKYTNWNKNEPNNESGREDYGMFYYKAKAYKWNDGDFGHGTVKGGAVFICEWDG